MSRHLFWYAVALRDIVVPSSVQSIGDECFCGCFALETIVFEAGSQLSTVGDFAFQNCTLLRSCSFPVFVLAVGRGCFAACWSLEFVAFEWGSRLEVIGQEGFSGWRRLTALYIPSTVRICVWDNAQSLASLVRRERREMGSLGDSTRMFPARACDEQSLEGRMQLMTDLVASLAGI
jgi:hypothetical protein